MAVAVPVKRTIRPPPRLRVKTGCTKCRERRKKCDERRPVCSACERLKIECAYRDNDELSDTGASPVASYATSSESRRASQVETPVALSPRGHELFFKPRSLQTPRDFVAFQYCAERFVHILTNPDCRPEFRNVSAILSVGLDEPWAMHAILAPAALHASCVDVMPRSDAISYTQSAIQGLRQALLVRNQGHPSHEHDIFLAVSLFLGLFEDFYGKHLSHSLTHYKAIANVLEEQFANLPRLDFSELPLFYRVMLDSVLYHISTRSIFERDLESVVNSFPRETIMKYVDALEANIDPSSPDSSILPVIGTTPPQLFLIIYQITWLGRQVPLHDEQSWAQALQCEEMLGILESSRTSTSLDLDLQLQTQGGLNHSNSDIATELFFLMTRVFLSKILDPDSTNSHSPAMHDCSVVGLKLLQLYDATAPYAQFLCWPLLVLGCLACAQYPEELDMNVAGSAGVQHRRELRSTLQSKLVQIWKTSYSGFVSRTASALQKIWKLPEDLRMQSVDYPNQETRIRYDGLLALVSKTGINAVPD